MAATPSTMLELGTPVPEFSLPDTGGRTVSSSDYKGQPLLVMFICNHCPFVKHVIAELSSLASEYQERGVNVVAVNSNDVAAYPEDSPDRMKAFAANHGFSFPYLYDESQQVAKLYRAACTPDFFLFDEKGRLVYRGQMDGSRPGNDVAVSGKDLTRAVNALVSGGEIPSEQNPSMGCNIKWRPGNAPDYFG